MRLVGHKQREAAERQVGLDRLSRDPSLPSVQTYVSRHIDLSGKTQRQIARETGIRSPQMLTMIKNGHTRLPLDFVEPLARALEVDPVHLMRLWLNDYHPATLKLIEGAMGMLSTDNERDIIECVRASSRNSDPELDEDRLQALAGLFRA
jgi:transcriptional regulator with XRE-family HTH domain